MDPCPDCGDTTEARGKCPDHPTSPKCPVCGYCDECAAELGLGSGLGGLTYPQH